MKLLEIFISFFKIGIFSFGGGYAMIPMFEKEITKYGWASISEYAKMVAIAQMVPGPFAIDSSAFIGYRAAGLVGALVASFALSLPSFIFSLIIAKFYIKFSNNKLFIACLNSIRPSVAALLIFAAYIIGIKPFLTPNSTQILIVLIFIILGIFILKYTKISMLLFLILCALFGFIIF